MPSAITPRTALKTDFLYSALCLSQSTCVYQASAGEVLFLIVSLKGLTNAALFKELLTCLV